MKLIILTILFIGSSSYGQLTPNWTKDILERVNKLNTNIQGNVVRLNKQIQEAMNGRLAFVDRLNEDVAKKVGKVTEEVRRLPKNSHTFTVNNNSGSSRVIVSGTGDDGQPYFRDIQDTVIDGTLFHTERVYNPKTKSMDVYEYTLDLNDPSAKPVPIVKE
ncbi:uncharacterized protein LOC122849978 [Aphidius gifuensis]|uniref:uncharacterized protein LOC122849978 n=1 Tax=Aphidius gifuensis TaxID=684658 RepID=UPI001CDC9083|nr:uncharacterized protein LOC122849978 [Aphidius gifuensis]